MKKSLSLENTCTYFYGFDVIIRGKPQKTVNFRAWHCTCPNVPGLQRKMQKRINSCLSNSTYED